MTTAIVAPNLNFDLALVFKANSRPRTIEFAVEVLEDSGFVCKYVEEKIWDKEKRKNVIGNKIIFIKIEKYKRLLQEAQNMKLEKPKY